MSSESKKDMFVLYSKEIHSFLFDKKCSHTYAVLLHHLVGKEKYTCWPSKSRIAYLIGATKETVRLHLVELENSGLIVREIKRGRSSNTYTVRTRGNFNDKVFPAWNHIDRFNESYEEVNSEQPSEDRVQPQQKIEAEQPETKGVSEDSTTLPETQELVNQKTKKNTKTKKPVQQELPGTNPVLIFNQEFNKAFLKTFNYKHNWNANDHSKIKDFFDNYTPNKTLDEKIKIAKSIIIHWEKYCEINVGVRKYFKTFRPSFLGSQYMAELVQYFPNMISGEDWTRKAFSKPKTRDEKFAHGCSFENTEELAPGLREALFKAGFEEYINDLNDSSLLALQKSTIEILKGKHKKLYGNNKLAIEWLVENFNFNF